MKKMPLRRDNEDVISGRLIFRTFQMHVTLHRIYRFQRFHLKLSVDSMQSYMHLKRVKNQTPRDDIFFIVAQRWHLHRCGEMTWCSPQPLIYILDYYFGNAWLLFWEFLTIILEILDYYFVNSWLLFWESLTLLWPCVRLSPLWWT